MKKLMLALLVAAVVEVPADEAFSEGHLRSGEDIEHLRSGEDIIMQATATASNADSTAVTVMYLKDKLEVAEVAARLAVPAGMSDEITLAPPNRVHRVIILVDTPRGGTALVRVIQGTTQFERPLIGKGRLVFDVAP